MNIANKLRRWFTRHDAAVVVVLSPAPKTGKELKATLRRVYRRKSED